MNVLLIEPPPMGKLSVQRVRGCIGTAKSDIVWPPLDLMMVAGYLRDLGIEASICDAHTLKLTDEEIKEAIKKENPRLVVFNSCITSIDSDVRVAKIAKELSNSIITAAFGVNIVALPEETLKKHRYLDIAIYSSDPEPIVADIVKFNYIYKEVQGICFREDGNIVRNEPAALKMNLDELGIPAHDQIDKNLYKDPLAKRQPMTIVSAQRGCCNRCTYCMSILHGKYRKRSIPHVIKELKQIERLGFREIMFFDCGLTNDIPWADNLFEEMIKERIGLTWWCTARSDKLNEQIFKKMKLAGCHSVGIGMESVDPVILANVKKRISPEIVKQRVQEAKKAGICAILYFMFGLPGETKKTIRDNINFAKTSGAGLVTFGIATPHPGTPFYDYMKNSGYLSTDDWSKYDPVKIPVYNYPNLSAQEIFAASRRAYRSFYLRPCYIIKRLFSRHTFWQVLNDLSNFKVFFKRYILKSKRQ